jgi:phage terminase large subunit
MKIEKQIVVNDYLAKYQPNPDLWCKDILGVQLWSKQKEIIRSIFQNRDTRVRSCYSIGKTFVSACAVLAFINLMTPCKIITTAPTWNQVSNLLWSEINYLFKTKLQPQGFPGVILQTMLRLRDDWFAIGFSSRESVNFQGYHQKNILVILDEAPGIRPEIVDGTKALTSSGNAHTLWIGNPIDQTDHFFKSFHDPSIPDHCKFKISAFDTPNFTDEKVSDEIRERLINPQWVNDRKKEWGENSPLYQSKVLAEFPEGGENQVITLKECEEAKNRDIEPTGIKELGVDVARFGSDLTVYTQIQGNVIFAQITESKKDTMEITGRIKNMMDNEGFVCAKIDVIGIGSGVVDRLRELIPSMSSGRADIIGINSSEKAFNSEQYFNRRTEMWFDAKEWLKEGKIPNDDNLIADLTAPLFTYTSKGQYRVESKEETKKRLGRSPDRGDSAIMAIQNTTRMNKAIYSLSESMSYADLGIE